MALNPENYSYNDGSYEYKLFLDQQKVFQFPRNDSYFYKLVSYSKEDGSAAVGWQTGGIDLHESKNESFVSTVKSIKGEFRNFQNLNNKPVFVVTVNDKGKNYFYILYPKQSDYENDYAKVINIDLLPDKEYNEHGFKDTTSLEFIDYKFLEKEGEVLMYYQLPNKPKNAIEVSFTSGDKGEVIYSSKPLE